MDVYYWSVRSSFDNVKMTFAIRTHADSVSTGTYSERQRTYTEAAKFEYSQ